MADSRKLDQDHQLFTALFRRYAGRIFAYFKKHVKRDDLAEDLLQEVFASIWQKKDTVLGNDTVEAYLFVAARNQLYNFLAKERRLGQTTLPLEDALAVNTISSYSVEQHLALKEIKEKYRVILDSLSPQRKMAFELSREYGLSYDEIAGRMDIAPRTVEKHISAALQSLRSGLAEGAIISLLFIIW
ncbi:MAG: RNA polymerase sigma-70 factor [Chitinophagaceae bacterium]|nr:RNA polymerase sigma-70 factor [Chitinophagaceae bacterium]